VLLTYYISYSNFYNKYITKSFNNNLVVLLVYYAYFTYKEILIYNNN